MAKSYQWTIELIDGSIYQPSGRYMVERDGFYVFYDKKHFKKCNYEIRCDAIKAIKWPARG